MKTRNLFVDGSDGPNPDYSAFAGDGEYPPFVVFNADAQVNILPYYQTREAAEVHLGTLLLEGVLDVKK